ncbi:MAG: hypothetical protein JXA69_09805, partial [Phycisphaerae bacterium]|nr:hypothetical protein [Phycisphaerae bacterium]
VIEERDGGDARLRYHVNGAQYIDERVATYAEAPAGAAREFGATAGGAFTYYLLGEQFSVIGTGNADGSVIERLNYSASGDFTVGSTGPATWIDGDSDGDGDVDLSDFGVFSQCFNGPNRAPAGANCDGSDFDTDNDVDLSDFGVFSQCFNGPNRPPASPDCVHGQVVSWVVGDADGDGDVDLADFGAFSQCFNGPNRPPAGADCDDSDLDDDNDVDLADFGAFSQCFNGPNRPPASPDCVHEGPAGAPGGLAAGGAPSGAPAADELPPSGVFALHGRPVDILSDGLVLIPVRARTYDPRHGRWLQRDPTGYADGPNLYEAFRGNATVFTDPMGEQTTPTNAMLPFGLYTEEQIRRAKEAAADAWAITKGAARGVWGLWRGIRDTSNPITNVQMNVQRLRQGYATYSGFRADDETMPAAIVLATTAEGARMLGGDLVLNIGTQRGPNGEYLGLEDLSSDVTQLVVPYAGGVFLAEFAFKPATPARVVPRAALRGAAPPAVASSLEMVAPARLTPPQAVLRGPINPRLLRRIEAWQSYEGGLNMRQWVAATQRQYGGVSGGYRSGYSAWERSFAPAGNGLLGLRTASLYRLENIVTGEHMKWGMTNNPARRYSQTWLKQNDLLMFEEMNGPRALIAEIERLMAEHDPGPLNKEPWAGRATRTRNND